jgi:hypothetical protein
LEISEKIFSTTKPSRLRLLTFLFLTKALAISVAPESEIWAPVEVRRIG